MAAGLLDLTEPIWLLDLEVGGRLALFATAGAEVLDSFGELRLYREGLGEITLTEGDADSAELQAPIEIAAEDLEGVGGSLTGAGTWAALIAAGWELEGARATLRRWTPGTVLDRSRVAIRGAAEDVSFGGPLEPLVFSLVRSPVRASRPLVDPAAVIDEDAWPVTGGQVLDEKSVGAWYPLIFGYPGSIASWPNLGTITASTPAPAAELDLATPANSRLLLAGGEVHASSVRVYDYDVDAPSQDTRPVVTTTDLLGRTVSVCTLGAILGATGAPGRAYYVAWSEAAGFGGGALRLDRSGPVRGMGEIIRYLSERFASFEVDLGRMEAAREDLDAWQIDTVVNEPENAWEWIRTELLPLAPLRVVEGRRGLFVRRMRYGATELDATAYLSVDRGDLQLVSNPRTRAFDQVANELTIQFGPERQGGAYRTRRVLTAEPDPGDFRILGSFRCAVSQRRLELRGVPGSGIRPWSLSSANLWHVPSALRTLDTWAEALALPHWSVSYEGAARLEDRFEVGDVLVLDHAALGWTARVALVEGITAGGGSTLLDLSVLTDPARVARALQ